MPSLGIELNTFEAVVFWAAFFSVKCFFFLPSSESMFSFFHSFLYFFFEKMLPGLGMMEAAGNW